MTRLTRFWHDEGGATAIEYGMIGALVFLVIIGSVTAFGEQASAIIVRASEAISEAIAGD